MSLSSPPLSPRGAEEEGDTRSDGTGSGGGAVLSYGEAGYWDAHYVEEGGAPYDWYQRDAPSSTASCRRPPASSLSAAAPRLCQRIWSLMATIHANGC
ncbi:hypothetical protein ZWY2020_032404 [Hordeum vulgare]|nr:hypothetical protein ZWY2020_032404 [Hordeum vulgare]